VKNGKGKQDLTGIIEKTERKIKQKTVMLQSKES
jgi:hypothetical protein